MMHDCNNNRSPRASKANHQRSQPQQPLWSSPLSVMDSREDMHQQDSFHLDYWEEENSEEDLEVGSSANQPPHRTRFLSQPEGWKDEDDNDDETQEVVWNSQHYHSNNSPRRRLYYHPLSPADAAATASHNHSNNTIQSNRQRAQSEPDARQVFPIRRHHHHHHKRRLWQEPVPAATSTSNSRSITTELAAPPPPLPPQHSTVHNHQSQTQQQQQPPPHTQSSEGQAQTPPSPQQPSPQQQQPPSHPHHSSLLVLPGGSDNNNNNNLYPTLSDRERRARVRWVRINRRFQLVITIVALLFSLLLFAILISWVVLTSAYVVSFDKSCDVPLKPYFWLVTLQLVLDVFRSDIMRWVFHWDTNSNQRIPCRVIVYNMVYLLYAMLVLRLGINAVFVQQSTCRETASELYNASAAFISLSMAAWATIVGGYLLPFCVVAALLTCNGYNPSNTTSTSSASSPHPHNATTTTQAVPVFPAAYSNTGAPSHCIELLPIVTPVPHQECCICMEEFTRRSAVVETTCKHVFHQQCCREWLLQARTCPVCRTDIAASLEQQQQQQSSSLQQQQQQQGSMEPTPPPPLIPLGPTGRPVVGLLRMLHRPENQAFMRSRTSSGGGNNSTTGNSNNGSTHTNSSEVHTHTTAEAPLRARSSSVNMPDASSPGI